MKAVSRSPPTTSAAPAYSGSLLAAAAVVFAAALWCASHVRLRSRSDLSPGSSRIRSAQALPGLGVRFDDAALKWSHDESRLNLVIFGARVLRRESAHHRAGARSRSRAGGRAVPEGPRRRRSASRSSGVQLTLVHGKDGVLRLGTGGAGNQSDVLQRIRDAIAKGRSRRVVAQQFRGRESAARISRRRDRRIRRGARSPASDHTRRPARAAARRARSKPASMPISKSRHLLRTSKPCSIFRPQATMLPAISASRA